MSKGMVGWAGGSSGPDLFIYTASRSCAVGGCPATHWCAPDPEPRNPDHRPLTTDHRGLTLIPEPEPEPEPEFEPEQVARPHRLRRGR